MLDFEVYVRKPFKLNACRVTKENIDELSELIGNGDIRRKDNGVLYFEADPEIIRNITRVEVGYWITRMDEVFRVYKPHVFEDIFTSWETTVDNKGIFTYNMEEAANANETAV